MTIHPPHEIWQTLHSCRNGSIMVRIVQGKRTERHAFFLYAPAQSANLSPQSKPDPDLNLDIPF